MSSENYRIDKFIEEVEVKNKFRLLYNIREEINEVKEGESFNTDNKKINYVKKLRGLQYFIRTGLKPELLDENEFEKFKPICKELVDKGQIDAFSLNLFDM